MPGGTSSRRTVLQLEDPDNPGDFIEIQCDLNQLTYSPVTTIEEDQSFCDTQKDYGSTNISITGSGRWAGEVDRAFRILDNARRNAVKIGYKYGPGGSDTGDYGLSGILIVGRVEIGAQVGQLVGLSFDAGVDGNDVEFTWP